MKTAMPDGEIAVAIEHCRIVTKQRAKNFYYGIQLMPEPKRSAMVVLYAFMRACDDLADQAVDASGDEAEHQSKVASTLSQIQDFRQTMHGVFQAKNSGQPLMLTDPMWLAFGWMVEQYPVEIAPLDQMLDGQINDLTHCTCATFDDLYRYCYQVASTVGLACVSIWSGQQVDDQVQRQAEHRGIALQLTNILRDVKEDAQRGRVYLPESELAKAGWSSERFRQEILSGQIDRQRFALMMKPQIQRAQEYYARSAGLENHLPADCRPTCWAMMRIYHRLLEKIQAQPTSVLDRRIRLNLPEKLLIAWRALRWST